MQLISSQPSTTPPEEAVLVSNEQIISILTGNVERNPKQPREEFDKAALIELMTSIVAIGQKVPGFVTPKPGCPGQYIIVDGERRWRACKMGAVARFNAIVIEGEEIDLFIQSTIANCARVGLSHVESARAIARIKGARKDTHAKIATYFGQSVQWVEAHLSLLKLPAEIIRLMCPPYPPKRRLTYSIALLLVSLPRTDQLELGHKFHAEGTKFNTAKHLIEERKRELEFSGVRQPQPNRDYQRLYRFAKNLADASRLLLATQDDAYARVLGTRSASECEELIQLLEDSRGNLARMQQAIGRAHRKKLISAVP